MTDISLKPDGFDEQKLFVLPDFMMNELQENPLTNSFYVSDIGYFPRAKYHYRERPQGCDSHILMYCVQGEGWMERHHNKLIQIKSRQLAVIPASKRNTCRCVNSNLCHGCRASNFYTEPSYPMD